MMSNESGFTLAEVIIATVLVASLLTLFYTAVFDTYRESFTGMASARMAVDSDNILLRMSEEIRVAAEIRNTNSISDPYAPAGGWKTGVDTNQIVIAVPAKDNNNEFIINESTGNPYMNEVIFFGENDTVYKRSLANSLAPGNVATTTCPEEESSSSCPKDKIFTINLKDMTFTFYDQDDQLITTSDYSRARSVVSEIDTSKQVFGKVVEFKNIMRMTLRNYAP